MAIVNFTLNESSVPVGAHNVKEIPAERYGHKIWTWESHVGLCIKEREVNGYNDSDFYMTFWNFEKNAPEDIEFATTRGWTYPAYASYVDATPEVMDLYNKWIEVKREEARLRAIEIEKKTVRKYKEVKVVKGRKVPVGTTGRVFWIGNNGWGDTAGIETAAGSRLFTSVNNLEVIYND